MKTALSVAAGVSPAGAAGAVGAAPVAIRRLLPLTPWLLCLAIAALHLWSIAAGIHDLAPDEAHYWEWSRRLDWSYYSKGPMVAYLIAAATAVGGNTAFFVRLPAVLLSCGTSVLLFLLARERFGTRAGLATVLLISACPLFNVGAMLMTTDAPLLFFWALLLYGLHRALSAPARSRWWWLCGASVGLGFLSKYTMLLALACGAAAACRSPSLRAGLRTRSPYGAALLAAVLAAPVLLWNLRHDWVSVRHVSALAGLAQPLSVSPASFFELVAGQLAVMTPGVLAVLLAALARGPRAEGESTLIAFTVLPLVFFLTLSLFSDVEANWPAPGYVAAFVLGGAWWSARLAHPRTSRGAALAGMALVLIPGWSINSVGHFPVVLSQLGVALPPRLDPAARVAGWADLGAAVGRIWKQDPSAFIVSESYQVSSALAFYVPGRPVVHNIDLGRRANQYDLWGGLDAMKGRDGLYVTAGRWDGSHPIRAACDTLEPLEIIDIVRRGELLRSFSVLRCGGYRGLPPPAWQPTY